MRRRFSPTRGQLDKQTMWATTALAAVEKNRNADAFTLAVRGIEETIAATFQTTGAQRAGQAARGQFAAGDRNVEGNTVDAVIGDVTRQEGDLMTMVGINRDAAMRQLERGRPQMRSTIKPCRRSLSRHAFRCSICAAQAPRNAGSAGEPRQAVTVIQLNGLNRFGLRANLCNT